MMVYQQCGTYSVARATTRWPLVIFFSLMDLAGINAQVIFFSNETNQKNKRRIFLKNLSLSLMKSQLVERSKIPSLPVSIATFLLKYKETIVQQVEEPAIKKRGRCATCGHAKNSSTTIKCDSCYSFVCKNHAKITHTKERSVK